MIDAGKLRHRITFKRLERVDDAAGGSATQFVDFSTVWSNVEPISTRERFQYEAAQNTVTHRITIRHLPGIADDMRIFYGSREFHIVGIRNLHEIDALIEIVAEEVKADGAF